MESEDIKAPRYRPHLGGLKIINALLCFRISSGATVLELSFDAKPLRDICESEETAKRKLGPAVARELKRCLADLRAAASIEDLPMANMQKGEDSCVFDLASSCRLVVIPSHIKNPLLESGVIDWATVRRIKVVRIECDHD